MKRVNLLIILFFVIATSSVMAATKTVAKPTAEGVMKSCIDAFKKGDAVTANFLLKSPSVSTSGTLLMQGDKFRTLSKNFKCWYDGQTQWVYTTESGELTITMPTKHDLAMSNPYFALMALSQSSNVKLAVSGATYTLELFPKKKTDIKGMKLVVSKSEYRILSAALTMQNGNIFNLTLSNYKGKQKVAPEAFKCDKKLLPKGVVEVDLR